jgi:hypothetical protein
MNKTWKQSLATIPGVGVSLLPKLACPLCWPAYAGLLSSIGLGFLISARYLLPVTTAFLEVAVGALAHRANLRHGYRPFLLGLFAALGVLLGKFWWESNLVMYASLGLLVMASVWNAWPHRAAVSDCCAEKSIN